MPIRKRLLFQGSGLFFITTTVVDWIPIFANRYLALMLLDQLNEATAVFDVSVVGYVLMPSHFHGMLGLRNVNRLSQFMRSFKSLSSKKLKQADLGKNATTLWKNDHFALWQPRFDDLLIVSEKQFKIKMDYIHNNPVKAGLVENATGYEFSSARDWTVGESGIIKIDKLFSWQI